MSRRQRVDWWVLLALAAVATAVWARRSGDFDGYLIVGELALAGRDIYRDSPPGINTWPPLFGLLCVPLALLARPSVYLARGVWLVINFACLWAVLRMLTRLVFGVRLEWRGSATGLSVLSAEILLPIALCGRFILSNFEHLQVNIVIFACAVAGLYWHARGHERWGAWALGGAAALKVMPIVFLPYFVYRRQWRMAIQMTVATAALSVAPAAIFGVARFSDYLVAWSHALRLGWGVSKMNQSVFAMFDRYIGQPQPPWRAAILTVVPASGDPRATVAALIVLGIVAGTAMWLFRGRQAPDSAASLAEYSVVFVVAALFGPVAWKAYLVVVLCPLMLLVRLLRQSWATPTEHRYLVGVLATYFVLAAMPGTDLFGRAVSNRLEMLSLPTLGTLALLAAVLWLRATLTVRPPEPWLIATRRATD